MASRGVAAAQCRSVETSERGIRTKRVTRVSAASTPITIASRLTCSGILNHRLLVALVGPHQRPGAAPRGAVAAAPRGPRPDRRGEHRGQVVPEPPGELHLALRAADLLEGGADARLSARRMAAGALLGREHRPPAPPPHRAPPGGAG